MNAIRICFSNFTRINGAALCCLLFLFANTVRANELVISGFPVGVGGSVAESFYQPHYPKLQTIADSLAANPLYRAIITGSADGIQYRQNNDAVNTGLALGRAHALMNLLINRFKVDSSQIIVQSIDVATEGAQYRSVSVRIVHDLDELDSRLAKLEAQESPEDNMRLHVGAGLSSSPYGVMPLVTASIDWRRFIYFEGLLGHTFWDESFTFQATDLDTKSRMVGVQIAVYPFENTPVGFVAGWLRTEEISQRFYEYVQLSEGLIVGLQTRPTEYLTITGAFNPSKRRIVDDLIAQSKNGQFWLSVTLNTAFGGK
jgi:hypothetical protein